MNHPKYKMPSQFPYSKFMSAVYDSPCTTLEMDTPDVLHTRLMDDMVRVPLAINAKRKHSILVHEYLNISKPEMPEADAPDGAAIDYLEDVRNYKDALACLVCFEGVGTTLIVELTN